jgi:hypothetical protein
VFTFVPPACAVDAASEPAGCGTFGGVVGSGSAFEGPGGSGRFERFHEYGQEGDTLIERYKLRAHGIDLNFERRLTFSDSDAPRELKVWERITGPKGEITRDLSLPLT